MDKSNGLANTLPGKRAEGDFAGQSLGILTSINLPGFC